MQDAKGAAGETRGVVAELRTASARLDPNEADGRMFQECVEESDGIMM